MHEENVLILPTSIVQISARIGQRKTVVEKSKESFYYSNVWFWLKKKLKWNDVALHYQLLKHTADHGSTHIYIGVYSIIPSSKTSFSHHCLNNGVPLEPSWACKNLLFFDFHSKSGPTGKHAFITSSLNTLRKNKPTIMFMMRLE